MGAQPSRSSDSRQEPDETTRLIRNEPQPSESDILPSHVASRVQASSIDSHGSCQDTELDMTQSKGTRPRGRWSALLACLNPVVSRSAFRLFEICDQGWFPGFLRRRCQSMLAAQWTHRIPLLQAKSPAQLAAELVKNALNEYVDADSLTVVDFCSGGGGPIPVIEQLVNESRVQTHQKPISFLLSDIFPSLDDWIDLAGQSDNLSFVPQPVDATNPPASVISSTAVTAPDFADSKIFRLFCLSFHHFDDEMARKVLRSSLETADGFAIVELQDRRPGSLLLMLADWPLLFVVSLLWFWWDPLRLAFTYCVPVLPSVMAFDGLVSCLRTREFDEVVGLLKTGEDGRHGRVNGVDQDWSVRSKGANRVEVSKISGVRWVLEGGRVRHTWPLGYMNYIVGRRIE